MLNSTMARRVGAALTVLGLGASLTACASADDADNDDTITLGYIAWDDAVVTSHLWQKILEDEGYTVELEELEPGLIFEGLANGDIDYFVSLWLPTTHAEYWEKYGDDLEKIGQWFDDASLAVTVPEYMDVRSLEDLNDYSEELDGEIIGIEDGAGITQATQDSVLPDYGLEENFELKTSSTPVMLETLDTAYQNEEPVAVTLWHPHWAYSSYDLVDLKDPKESLGGPEQVSTVARGGFSEDYPEIAGWIENFKMTNEQLEELENVALNEHDDPETGTEKWYEDNEDFVEEVTK